MMRWPRQSEPKMAENLKKSTVWALRFITKNSSMAVLVARLSIEFDFRFQRIQWKRKNNYFSIPQQTASTKIPSRENIRRCVSEKKVTDLYNAYDKIDWFSEWQQRELSLELDRKSKIRWGKTISGSKERSIWHSCPKTMRWLAWLTWLITSPSVCGISSFQARNNALCVFSGWNISSIGLRPLKSEKSQNLSCASATTTAVNLW